MLLLTLRGTPTIYMGEELGMLDTPVPADRIRDPAELREPGQGLGRDPERTPYPWDDSRNRGFTTGIPWLPMGTDPPHSDQGRDPASMLSFYRRLIQLRRRHAALAVGVLDPATTEGTVLRYGRHLDGIQFHILLNTGGAPADISAAGGTVLADTHAADAYTIEPGPLRLQPDQGILIRLSS